MEVTDTGIRPAQKLSDFILDISACGIIMAAVKDDCRILLINAAFLARTDYTEAGVPERPLSFLQRDKRDRPERAVLLAALHADPNSNNTYG